MASRLRTFSVSMLASGGGHRYRREEREAKTSGYKAFVSRVSRGRIAAVSSRDLRLVQIRSSLREPMRVMNGPKEPHAAVRLDLPLPRHQGPASRRFERHRSPDVHSALDVSGGLEPVWPFVSAHFDRHGRGARALHLCFVSGPHTDRSRRDFLATDHVFVVARLIGLVTTKSKTSSMGQ